MIRAFKVRELKDEYDIKFMYESFYGPTFDTVFYDSRLIADQHLPVYQGFGSSVLECTTNPMDDYTRFQGNNFAMPLMSYGCTIQTNAIRYISGVAIRFPNKEKTLKAIDGWENSAFGQRVSDALNRSIVARDKDITRRNRDELEELTEEERVALLPDLSLSRYLVGRKTPLPRYILDSGDSLWFMYKFNEAVPMYKSLATALQEAVDIFASKLYGAIFGEKAEDVIKKMHTPLNRPVPVVGSRYKGYRVKAYSCCEHFKEGVNMFLVHLPKEQRFTYKQTHHTLEEAEELFPDWFFNRVIRGVPASAPGKRKDPWGWIHKGFYNWFYKQCLDCKGLKPQAPRALLAVALKTSDYISKGEIIGALTAVYQRLYGKSFDYCHELAKKLYYEITNDSETVYIYKILKKETLTKWSGIEIKSNKRNGRTLKDHLKLLNKTKKENFKNNPDYSNSKCGEVVRWRKANPGCNNKSQCARDLGIDRRSVAKYWDAKIINHKDGSTSIKGVKKGKVTEKQKAKRASLKRATAKKYHDAELATRRLPPRDRERGLNRMLVTVRFFLDRLRQNKYRLFRLLN